MRFAELTARAMLSGISLPVLQVLPEVSNNSARMLIRQEGDCGVGKDICGTGCMPSGSTCCAPDFKSFCDPGYYCTTDGGCYVCTSDGCERGSGGGGGGGGGGGSSGCDQGEKACDSDYCIPSGGVCCGLGNGNYCDEGYYCTAGACCRNGKTCTGRPPTATATVPAPDFTTSTADVQFTADFQLTSTTTATSSPETSTTSDAGDNGVVPSPTSSVPPTDRSSTTAPSSSSPSAPAQTPSGSATTGSPFTQAAAGLSVPGCLGLVVAAVMALMV
ncbi:c58de0b6-9748-4b98-9eba-8357ea482849 [Thermothielavioides terrestris]|uniref:C58de0b6-9748-4b98-9eba-8357ea482849 n=1 Tax=Thermothielavioides terrestris TaxID=2587410 RepID=A0A446BLD5_9PEZI|nr:c58de0b6-9748-4b98-9eba-8357ea482849 [Thermothielavioides terrestris]